VLAIRLRTPARLPFPHTRDTIDELLNRIRGRKIRVEFEQVRRPEPKIDPSREQLWLLDETGAGWDSRTWARKLEESTDAGVKSIVLFVGGSHGVSPAVRKQARQTISLGHGTFPSWLACLVAAEQIYRADSILRGSPYHHG